MPRIIPNEEFFISVLPAVTDVSAPTAAEVTAGQDITSFVVSLTASTQGNQLPTPAFDSLFETSISGTVQASFTMDCYRDDTTDTAWDTLPRGTDAFVLISRFGTAGAAPTTADVVEIWPIRVTSRSMQAASSNQVQMFQVTCAIIAEPDEAAVIAA